MKEKSRTINPFSMDSINPKELLPQQGRVTANDEAVLVIGGHIQHSRFLEEGKIYQIVEPRLVFVMEGHADLCINLQDWHLEKGMLMVLPADTIVDIKKISEETRVVAIIFRKGVELPEESVLTVSPTEADRLLRMIYLVWDFMQVRPVRRTVLRHLLQALVDNVQYIRDTAEKAAADSIPMRMQETFRKFRRLVHRHCVRERSIPFYAGELNMTPHYLSSVIKKASGRSVMYWVNRATVQEAKILLETGGLTGCEIAYRLHFPSASAFSKFFRREVGTTPRKYREECG